MKLTTKRREAESKRDSASDSQSLGTLLAMNVKQQKGQYSNIYSGTVDSVTVRERRAKNKIGRKQARTNRRKR